MFPIPVAILAGGLATRLRPITEKIPKSLLTVAGQPFLAHQLKLLHKAGLREVVMCVGHLGEMIQQQYGDGADFGLRLQYSFDGPNLLGTGGALRRALPLLGREFFVLYGDSYLPIDYQPVAEAFASQGREGLMTVFRNENQYDTSNVWFAESEIKVYDKKQRLPEMHHIDYGLSVLSAGALESWPTDTRFDLAELLQQLVARRQLAGYEVRQRFYEIGSHRGLQELETYLQSAETS